MEPTHYDITVILAVIAAFVVTVTVAGFAYFHHVARDISRTLAESQRLTRAVAGLVVQESDRIRRLFNDSRP